MPKTQKELAAILLNGKNKKQLTLKFGFIKLNDKNQNKKILLLE